MSCHGFHHVLVLLDDDTIAMQRLMNRAIELADVERARLTIAKTTDPGRVVRWFAPLATLSRCSPMVVPDTDFARTALDRATAHVPASIPLTRVLLGSDTVRALRRLAKTDLYDLLIVSDKVIAHNRALRRQVRQLGLCTLSVCPDSADPPEENVTESATTQEDVLEHQH